MLLLNLLVAYKETCAFCIEARTDYLSTIKSFFDTGERWHGPYRGGRFLSGGNKAFSIYAMRGTWSGFCRFSETRGCLLAWKVCQYIEVLCQGGMHIPSLRID